MIAAIFNHAKKLKKTAVDLNKTGFQYSFDNTPNQRNGVHNRNNSFGVQQIFSLPSVYSRQRKFLNEQFVLSEKSLTISKADLIRNVRTSYYQLVYRQAYLGFAD